MEIIISSLLTINRLILTRKRFRNLFGLLNTFMFVFFISFFQFGLFVKALESVLFFFQVDVF